MLVEFKVDQLDEVWRNFSSIVGDAHSSIYTVTLDTTLLYDGSTTLAYRATDNLNHVALTEIPVVIDNDIPPQAALGLEGAYISFTEVELNWNLYTEPDFAEYQLFRNTTSTLTGADRIFVNETITTATWVDDTITTTIPNYYYYMLRVVDSAGNVSKDSAVILIGPPGAPENLVAIGRDGEVDLSWNSVSEGFVDGYDVYRSTDGGTNYSKLGSTNSRTAVTYNDDPTTNGQTFHYYVVAIDGADNPSQSSNIATATPNTVASVESVYVISFEDKKDLGNVDWDFDDITLKLETTLFLNNDNVTTIVMKAEALVKNAGYDHKLNLDIHDMVGSATVNIERFDSANQSSTPDETVTDFNYEWQGTNGAMVIFISSSDGVGSIGTEDKPILGDTSELKIVLNSPSSNPFSGFDKAPFDSWMHVITTSKDVHIFDPLNGDYAEENQQVINDSDLEGVYLNLGLKVPGADWVPDYGDSKKIWTEYPDFIDWAKTVRTQQVEKSSWFDNPAN